LKINTNNLAFTKKLDTYNKVTIMGAHGAKYKTKNKMNTLTNEQVGLQIAKQTINKLNKNMMVGYFQNQNLNWLK
jgi:hypothetical protein